MNRFPSRGGNKNILKSNNKIAGQVDIKQRQRYTRESKQLLHDTYNGKYPGRIKKAAKAKRRLKTVANTRMREFDRKMNEDRKRHYEDEFSL